MLILIICTVVALALDLITKYTLWGGGQTIIPSILSVSDRKVENHGMAFGIPAPVWFLIVVTFMILIVGVYLWVRFKTGRTSKVFNIGCGLVLGGALGNLFDRIFFGFVRDFIQFDFWTDFPVMNLADWFINIGMVLLIVYFIFIYKGKARAKTKG
jgi:signal peptidase II